MSNVKVTIHKARVISVVGPIAEKAAYSAAQKARGYVISEIRIAGRVRTGKMIQLMQVRRLSKGSPLRRSFEVFSSAPYTGYQNDGTRGHGPRNAKFLAFVPKGGTNVVFAKYVRGVTGAHFMEKGLARLRVQDFTG